MNTNDPGGTASRAAAVRILTDVLSQRRFLDDVLVTDAGYAELAPRDKSFVRNLVATCFRHLGETDAVLDHCLERPLGAKATAIQNLLRIGVTQLLHTDTPPHAAVDTAVDLAKTMTGGAHTKLVNAVLRRVDRERAALTVDLGADLGADLNAARLNTPAWLLQQLEAGYGVAAARNIAEAQTRGPAPLDLSVKADASAWAERLGGRLLGGETLRLEDPPPVTEIAGFADGAWWVQDAAAALPARMLGDVRGKRVLDLCAAPGGKTAQLAAAGARVTALDRNKKRMARLEENLGRLRLEAEIVIADALAWSPDTPFDAVLLDAPCSATGTVRRHPELPWIKDGTDLPKLTSLQTRLLDRAADWVAPGGRLIYATCSLLKAEGEDQMDRFLGARPEFRQDAPEDPKLAPWLDTQGALRTTPTRLEAEGGMDGFFACLLTHGTRVD